MKLTLDAEQEFLRQSTRRFLARESSIARTRVLVDVGGPRFDRDLWTRSCRELGLAGLLAAPSRGGSGAGLTEASIAVEEFGAAIDASPLLSVTSAVIALEAIGGTHADDKIPALLDGEQTAAVVLLDNDPEALITPGDGEGRFRVSGRFDHVLDAPDADLLVLVVRSGDAAWILSVDARSPGVTMRPVDALDLTRRWAGVTIADVVAQGTPVAPALVDDVRNKIVVLVAAELAGLMRASLRSTVDYLRTRVAFGRTVGSFQGVKHQLADMYCELELVQSGVRAATWGADTASDDLTVDALVAYRAACTAAVDITTDCLRLCGGIGYTWEHDAHIYVRRAHQDQAMFGGRGCIDAPLLEFIGV